MKRFIKCVNEEQQIKEVELAITFPYSQPFTLPDYVNKRDPINRNINSDMFFHPKRVLSFEDQLDKYLVLLVWGNLWPFNYIIPLVFVVNLF